MRLTVRYVQARVPVEVSIEGSDLQPEEACQRLRYIVTRVDAAIDKALPKSHGERGCLVAESTQPRLTAAAQPRSIAEREP